jgi:cell division septation protein DedD
MKTDTKFEPMKNFVLTLISVLSLIFSVSAQSNSDANQLFLVDIDNIYNAQMAGKPSAIPNQGDRALTSEEILMYEILGCRLENGKWIRYTSNSQAKGTIKVGHPSYDANKKIMIFISNIPGGVGGFDIYISQKIGNDWTDPKNAGWKVNSIGDEIFPVLTSDGMLQFKRDKAAISVPFKEVLEASPLPKVVKPSAPTPAVATPTVATPKPATPTTKPAVTAVTPVATPKPATPAVSPSVNNETLEYRVQLGSFGTPNWSILNQFSSLGKIQTIKTDAGLTSVHVGAFSSLEEAMKLLAQVRARAGFENAYVVGVKNGKIESRHK